MKRFRLFAAVAALVAIVAPIALLATHKAYASGTQTTIIITLAPDRSDATVKLHRLESYLSKNDYTLTRKGGTYQGVVANPNDTNQAFECSTPGNTPDWFSVTVTAGSSTIGTGNVCIAASNSYSPPPTQVSKTIPVQAANSTNGSLSGTITVKDPNNKNVAMNPCGGSTVTITNQADKTKTFTYTIAGTGDCNSNGTYTFANVPPGTYTLTSSGQYSAGLSGDLGYSFTKTGITIKPGSNSYNAVATGDKAASSNPDQGGSSSIDCTWSVNPLTWIVCPVVDGINSAAGALDSFINNQLQFDNSNYGGQTNNGTQFFDKKGTGGINPYYTAWSSFRVIAIAIIVIAGLIMVVSQALGFEVLDAYTVHKVLPRLFIAIVGISLSWPLMSFVVGFVNTLGTDIGNIMFAPFGGPGGAGGFSLFAGSIASGSTATGIGAGLLLAGVGLGILGALSFGLTALLALFVGFLIILMRNVALIAIMIVAPIAIACYVLPNTQKAWKMWSENFLGLLMVYPLIVVIIAAGKIFSWSALSSASGQDFSGVPLQKMVLYIMGFAAYIIPYFVLPLAFRLATGAVGTLAGFVNDRHRGAFDRLKKFRGAKATENLAKMKTGNRFEGNNALSRGFNMASRNVALAPSAGFNPAQWRSRFTSEKAKRDFDAAEELRTKNADFLAGAQDDRILRAVQYGTGRSDIRRRLQNEGLTGASLDNAVGIAARMQASGSISAVRQAAAIQRFATGTGYNDANGNFDYQAAMDSIRDASGGDRNLAGRLLGHAKGEATRAGQLGFGGASYTALSKGLDQSFDPRGLGPVDGDAIALNAWESNDAVTVARARVPHVKAMAGAANRRIEALRAGAPERTPGELGRLVAQVESFGATAGMYAAPDRQSTINDIAATTDQTRREVHNETQDARASQVYSTGIGDRNNPIPGVPQNSVRGTPQNPVSPNVEQFERNRSSRGGDPNNPFLPGS